jgi:hypothetical protein
MAETLRETLEKVEDEMSQALQAGSLFNPELFGATLKRGSNPILEWTLALRRVLKAMKPLTPADVQVGEKLRRLAKEATNGWACYAKRDSEHREIARLHAEIDATAALPDDPRDEKLRAFADAMTPEKWRRLNWQIEEALSEAQLQLSSAELRDDPQATQMEIDELRERRDSWAEIAASVEGLLHE